MSSELKVDNISEKTSAAGVTIDGVLIKDNVVNTDTISPKTTNGATILEVPVKKIQTLTSSSGTLTVNAGLGSQGQITLTENISTLAFTNIPTSGVFQMDIYITQHASSAKTVAFTDVTINGGSSVKSFTGSGTSLTMSTTASATDRYTFIFIDAGAPKVNQTANYQSGFPHTDGELIRVDAGDSESYTSGTTWYDLSGNGNHLTWSSTPTHSNNYFTLSSSYNFYRTNFINQVGSCYFVIQSNDTQSVFLSDNTSGSYYLAAFKSSNGFYNGGAGSPTAYVNTSTSTNLYNDFRSSSDIKLVTFTGMSCTNWSNNNMYLDAYNTFTWDGGGKLYAFGCYSDTLTSAEVSSIYNYYKDNKGYIT